MGSVLHIHVFRDWGNRLPRLSAHRVFDSGFRAGDRGVAVKLGCQLGGLTVGRLDRGLGWLWIGLCWSFAKAFSWLALLRGGATHKSQLYYGQTYVLFYTAILCIKEAREPAEPTFLSTQSRPMEG